MCGLWIRLERVGIAAFDAVVDLHAAGPGHQRKQFLVDRVDPRHHVPGEAELLVDQPPADSFDPLAVHRHGVVDEVEMASAVVSVERDHLIDDAVGRAKAELLAEQCAGAVGTSARTAPRGENVGVKVGVVAAGQSRPGLPDVAPARAASPDRRPAGEARSAAIRPSCPR